MSAVDTFIQAKNFIQDIWDDLTDRDLLADKDHIRFTKAIKQMNEIIEDLKKAA
jgi:hypothetical protein